MDGRLRLIQKKLALLKTLDTALSVFGASHHKYELNPCLREIEVSAFEKEHNVSLPQDFVLFLTCIGNGGAGPHYGLFPLAKSLINCTWGFLASPFPHVSAWNEPPSTTLSPEEYQAAEEHYFRDDLVAGTLAICHEGCGHVVNLVVSGSEHGNIWGDSRVSDQGIYPHENPMTGEPRITYLQWYENWLMDSLKHWQQ